MAKYSPEARRELLFGALHRGRAAVTRHRSFVLIAILAVLALAARPRRSAPKHSRTWPRPVRWLRVSYANGV